MANLSMVGRVTSELKIEDVADNKVGKFSLAVDTEKTDADGNNISSFVNVDIWNEKTQNYLAKNLKKGEYLAVVGLLQVKPYERADKSKDLELKISDPNELQLLGTQKRTSANVFISGRLTKDVEIKNVGADDKTVAEFVLAENYGKDRTNFFPIECWNEQAKVMSEHIGKGSLVGISGQLKIEHFERADKTKGTNIKIINPDVRFFGKTVAAESEKSNATGNAKNHQASQGRGR